MDRNLQLDEIDSLKSIYYDEEFQVTKTTEGSTQAIFWAYIELKDNYVVKYLESLDSPEPSVVHLKHLPPIELQLTLPEDYPSKNPPKFVISCQWLSKPKISLLCKKLDKIWAENGCVEIIYSWCNFLKYDTLEFLGCENELDITELCSKHLAFLQKIQAIELEKKIWSERNTAKFKKKEQNSNSNGEKSDKENKPTFEVLANVKPVSSKEYKDNHINHKRNYPYYRQNYRYKNVGWKSGVYKSKYDDRAVLNLNLKMSPIQVLVNYNTEREKVEFLRNFYTCNICFSDKLGKDCTKFQNCNHVFCIDCIRSYFTIKIKDGAVLSIKCPEDKCPTEALPFQVKEIVSEELFAKYDSVLLNTALDTLSDIIYCPRQICQYPVTWEPEEKMASCPNCQYVFCVTCKMVYHGIEPCLFKPAEMQKIVEKYENGSNEIRLQMESKYGKKHLESLVNNCKTESWINDNSKRCPKCNVAIEKSKGCNKMVCWKCDAYFCWLCCTILDRKNPYFHYNDPKSPCANKLFHLVYNFDDDDMDEWEAENEWFMLDMVDNQEDIPEVVDYDQDAADAYLDFLNQINK